MNSLMGQTIHSAWVNRTISGCQFAYGIKCIGYDVVQGMTSDDSLAKGLYYTSAGFHLSYSALYGLALCYKKSGLTGTSTFLYMAGDIC